MLLRLMSSIALLVSCSQPFAAETPSPTPCSTEFMLSHGGSFATANDGTRIWHKLAGREGAPVIVYLHGGPG